jgi:hypothetical protein
MKPTVLTILGKAAEGLRYPSETDAPFEPFSWGRADSDLTPEKAARLAGASAADPVEEQSADDFFQYLDAAENADQFRKLRQAVTAQLSGLRVFRIGQVNIDVYLVGRTKDGEWAGLTTHSVET